MARAACVQRAPAVRRRATACASPPPAPPAPPPPPHVPRRALLRLAAAAAAAAAAAPLLPPNALAAAAAARAQPAAESTVALVGATQLGAVDGTLGACGSGSLACFSTFDDRPAHFAAPWEYDGGAAADALDALAAAAKEDNGVVVARDDVAGYLRVAFTSAAPGAPPDADLEFLLQADGDATVAVRAAARAPAAVAALPRPDLGRTAERLFKIRRRLGWPEVFVLRGRGSALGGLLETPLDGFGPVPPAGGADYGALDDPLAS
jgi:hypothetical protein